MQAFPSPSPDAQASTTDAAVRAWIARPLQLSRIIRVVERAIAEGRHDLALRFADRAWRLSPDSATLCHIAMSLTMRLGDPDQALRTFSKLAAERINAELAALHVDGLRQAGRTEDAERSLHDYLTRFAIQPGGPLDRAARALHAQMRGAGWAGLTPDLRLIGEGERLEQCAATHPTDFGLSGDAEFDGRTIRGTVELGWLPADMPPTVVLRRGRRIMTLGLAADADRPGRFHFAVTPGLATRLTASRADLLIALPDGRRVPHPASPVLLRPVSPYRPRRRRHPRTTSAGLAVIIPVWRGETETRACIDSVLATVPADTPVVLVNDASPEPRITRLLRGYLADTRTILIENEANLGFPGAVNRGMAAISDHDVVLLNADTVVFPGWLERMRAHADADDGIATVTPLSNAGSIASWPDGADTECDRETALRRDRLVARVNGGETVDSPTAVGFCMFIRRACLKQVGPFDETLFTRGYGEENDFSLRASAHGWRHVIAADVYVLHHSGRSFGPARDGLRRRNAAVLSVRHPTYEAQVRAFTEDRPLAPLRRRLSAAALVEDGRKTVLLMSHGLGGGVGAHVETRMRELAGRGFLPLLLTGDADSRSAIVTTSSTDTCRDLSFRFADESDAFADFLRMLMPERVEIHHFLGMDEAFVDRCFAAGAPVDIFLHDYGFHCPRLTLLDANGRWCREPGLADCVACIGKAGSELHDRLGPEALRARSRRWLAQARSIVAPSGDVAQRHGRMFPGLTIDVQPWEETAPPSPALTPVAGPPWRIALIGAIGEQKGQAVLLDCARHAAERDLPIEFVLIGFAADEETLLRTGKLFVTGRYDHAELPALLRRERPHAIFLPSLTPETWSYALSEAMATGLPIVAFDIGAIAERLKASGAPHRLLPLDTDAAAIDRLLVDVASGATGLPRLPLIIHTSGASIMRDTGDSPTSLVEMLTLSRGMYQFSVEGDDADSPTEGLLPALQVIAAPGQPTDAVEHISPPAPESRWLRDRSDSILLRVQEDGTKVVVLLLTHPRLAPLRIGVRRLDETPPRAKLAAGAAPGQTPAPPPDGVLLRAQIVAHVEYVGDIIGMDQEWTGVPEGNRAIECLTITPIADTAPVTLEYRAMSAAGLDTGWVEQGRPCGTRGMALSLLGLAIRQKNGHGRLICEYSGRFASGRVVGPLRDGALCRSPDANDPLVGVWLHIVDTCVRRTGVEDAPPASRSAVRPRFGLLQDITA